MKIGLQIVSIEVNLLGFFIGIRSTFKGRIRSNLETIRDQSPLDWIAIKSRTRGNHEELKISFQNFLIASRLIKSADTKREEHHFYKRNPCENRGPFDLMKIGWTATIMRLIWAMITQRGPTFSLSFCPSDLDESVSMRPRVSPRWAKFAINLRPSDFINEIEGLEIVTCVDLDPVDCGPCNQRISIIVIASNGPRDTASPAI